MADISGLIVTVLGLSFELTSTLYSYSREVKGASRDIQQLSNELFSLIGVLEHIKMQQERESLESQSKLPMAMDKATLSRVLNETIEFLQELQDSLAAPKSRFQAVAQKLKWPLREKDTKDHLMRLERVKSYFVLSQVTEELDLSRQIASQISDLGSLIHQTSLDDKAQKQQQTMKNVIEWLSPVDPQDTYEKVAKSRAATSGRWITETGGVRRWRQSSTSATFWLNGITGAGKTTLMTTVIENLISEFGHGSVLYFYCSFANAESLVLKNIFGSILSQICMSDQFTVDKLESLYSKHHERGTATLRPRALEETELVDLIVQNLQKRENVFILLDGINECEEPQHIIDELSSIMAACPACSIHLFISSINEKDIEQALEELPNVATETLRQVDIQNDVRSLVLASLETDPRLRRHGAELKEEIEWALTRGAKGMFRWVQCQLDILSRLRTPGAIRKALSNLPPTLDKTYEGLLERIDGDEDRKLARDILEMICFSFRPLTLTEVCELLQVTPGLRKLDKSKCLADPKDILSICGSLLNYQQHTGHVTLAHHSVQTYLLSDLQGETAYFHLSEEEAHRSLATKCLTYLSFDDFSAGPRRVTRRWQHYQRFPVLEYAALRWAPHAQNVKELGDTLWTVLKGFLFSQDAGRGNFLAWVQLLIPSASIESIIRTPPLYYAASFGLTAVVRYLIEAGADLEVHAGRCGATPLNIASFRGHYDVVKLLLEHGADPNAVDDNPGWSAIQWAVYNRHTQIYELFMESDRAAKDGADKDTIDQQTVSPKRSAMQSWLRKQSIGQLVVTKAELDPRWSSRLWWILVGLAESESNNPIGEAIHQAAKHRLSDCGAKSPNGTIISFENISGMGIRAHIEVDFPVAGQRCTAPEELKVDWTGRLAEVVKVDGAGSLVGDVKDCEEYGQTWVAIDGSIAGVISLSLYS